MTPSWATSTDWDAAQSETGVHHEQPTGTDWAAADVVEKGLPADWSRWSVPAPQIYLPLQEDSGTTANEAIGGADGTVVGATVGDSNGVLGTTSYAFDGVDDSVDGIAYDQIWSGATWSIMVWFHRDTDAFDTTAGGDEGLVATDSDRSAGQAAVNLYLEDGDGSLKAQGTGNFPGVASTTTGLNDGTWHQAILTNDGSDTDTKETLYLDGVDDTSNINSTENTSWRNFSNNAVDIGRTNSGEDRPYGPGEIGHVAIWNVELTSGQVSELYGAFV